MDINKNPPDIQRAWDTAEAGVFECISAAFSWMLVGFVLACAVYLLSHHSLRAVLSVFSVLFSLKVLMKLVHMDSEYRRDHPRQP